MSFKQKLCNFLYKFRFGIIITGIVFSTIIFDFISKAITDGKTKTIIDGFISIFSTHNTGAAWSMLSSHTWLLIVLSVVFLAIILTANYFFKSKNYFYAIAMGLVLGGAFCNLYDRLVYGYVRDFISLDFISFPIFNLADCAITIGAIMLVVFFIVLMAKEHKAEKQTNANGKN